MKYFSNYCNYFNIFCYLYYKKACSNEPTQLSWLQDGGQKQPGMYKDNECSFATATPDGGDSVHVNMGEIATGMAFQPLMAIRNQVKLHTHQRLKDFVGCFNIS